MIKTYRPTTSHCENYFEDDVSSTLVTRYHYGQGGDGALVVYVIENHPADSRVTLCKDNIVQTLSSRMGTGGVMYLCSYIPK